jgi:hypothetical protein
VEEHLVIRRFIKKERTVGILRGEFATSREPLDLTEGAGEIRRSILLKVQSSGGAEPLIRATRAVGSTRISCIGVSWIETPKYCNRNRDIAIRDIPTVKEIVWGHRGSVVDRWHTLSGFRGEKSRNIDIRIRDPAKSEIPMEVKDR